MKEISIALIGIATVLSAVFLPMAFFDGASGVIYRQFAITIATAMTLSVFVAIVLTPAICATFLKPHNHKETGFFGWFNKKYDKIEQKYEDKVRFINNRPIRFGIIYLLIGVGTYAIFSHIPTGFIPKEDKGEIMAMYNLPVGATMTRTDTVGDQITDYFMNAEKDNLKYIFTVSGFSFAGSGENTGMAFAALKPWAERTKPEQNSEAVAGRAMGFMLFGLNDAQGFAITPPAIQGLGNSEGFSLYLQGTGTRESLKKIEINY